MASAQPENAKAGPCPPPVANSTADRMRLCELADIEDGGARGFDLQDQGRDDFFVVRRGNRVYAWRNACPHPGYEGATMPWRTHGYLNGSGSHVVCAGHGAHFEPETGECVRGPCLGHRLSPVRVEVSNGALYISQQELKEF